MPNGRSFAPWSQNIEEIFKLLNTNNTGLPIPIAKKLYNSKQTNEIQGEKQVAGWIIFFRQLKNPLMLLLIFASIIAYFLGDTTEVIIIISMVLISTILAFIQEYRSEKALRLLRKKLTRYAIVVRNNKIQKIDARELVVGDIVNIELGGVIPADLRLILVEDLEIDESMLTGESVPVSKMTEVLKSNDLLPQEQVNMAFMGTHVVQGSGQGVVVNIGRQTEMGKTAILLTQKVQETDFQKGVRNFSSFIIKIAAILIIFAGVGTGILRGDWIESILFALALAVGLSPELFPMIVTVNLSRGAMLMSKKSVLVKKLMAIEDLGNADVFCTDKTGTLTVGKIRVRQSVDIHGHLNTQPLVYAGLCLNYDTQGQANNPIDEAIFESLNDYKIKKIIPSSQRVDVISFDFTRRRMSTVIKEKNGNIFLITKGAVNEVLSICTTYDNNGKQEKIKKSDIKNLLKLADNYQDKGYRIIAVAKKTISEKNSYTPNDEHHMNLVGFILMSDAPKHTAKAALVSLKNLGVRIIILTGDSERITTHIAEQLNFQISGLLNGRDLASMSDAQLMRKVEKINVFAGITPAQKLRIINALKKRGHTVGFMGDGVNDAPSLHAADVGISFDDAIDVAKEAASIIMLKKNLSVLADGIREGRKTFVNTQTYINTTISSNFGNMLSLAGMSLLLPFIPMLPAQILLLNILSDLPMIGISSDRVADEDLARPKQWNVSRISNYMYFFGIISSVADYATFGILYFMLHANISLFRSGWFVESLVTEVIVIFLLRTKYTTLKNLPSKILTVLCIMAIIIALVITQTSIGRNFNFTALNLTTLFYISVIIAGYAILVEFGKRAFYKYIERSPST